MRWHLPLTDDNPAVAESGTITVTAPGEYCFFALYSGDDNYAEMGDDGTNECFSVSSQPTVATTQSWLPNDSAALDSGGGGALDGTAHFDLYKSDDCGVAGADAPVTRSCGQRQRGRLGNFWRDVARHHLGHRRRQLEDAQTRRDSVCQL